LKADERSSVRIQGFNALEAFPFPSSSSAMALRVVAFDAIAFG
jgi:hypothetical protein